MPTFGSLFSGIGGGDAGLEAAGWRCAWQVEIDAACNRVLARHWPTVPRYGDISAVDAGDLAPVDLIVFGSPCQDLSVAGKRAGLGGERSGLFYEAVRLLRTVRPALALWENVPGALSSHRGRDFAAVLDALADAGALDIAWRILDAQWFGVPQRRRRLFVVADFRAERAAAVLFEPESGGRHPAPGRQTGARVAASLVGGADSPRSRGKVNGENADVNLVCADTQSVGANQTTGFVGEAVVAHALPAHGQRQDASVEDFVVGADLYNGALDGATAHTVRAGNGNALGGVPAVITHALNGPHGGASEDGTGREVPLVLAFDTTQVTSDKNYSNPKPGDPCHPLAAAADAPAVAFDWRSGGDVRLKCSETHTSALQASQTPAVSGSVVRRLTPVECARLQGFPDDWLAGETDSAQYRMLGNAMAVPVLTWLGSQLREVLA